MQRPQLETVTLDDVVITEELSHRLLRPPNWQAENQAMRTLVQQLVQQPEVMLKSLVTMALDLCQAGTVGVSLLESTPNGEPVFRWVALAGALEQYEGSTTPRHFSPCGTCLDGLRPGEAERGTPLLYSFPDRYFTHLQEIKPQIVESLVLPFAVDNRLLGTLWIMSHNEERTFDQEDVRVLSSLADFTAAALLQGQTLELITTNTALQAEIVDRKRAEEALRASEEKYRTLFESINDGFCIAQMLYDDNGEPFDYLFLEVSPSVEKQTGITDVVGKTARQIDPNVEAEFLKNYNRVLLTGEPVHFEIRNEFFDMWLDVSAFPFGEPELRQFAVVFTNISDRKQAEIATQQANERFELAAAAVNAMIYDWNIQQDIVERTEGFTQILGYSFAETEPTGIWWRERIHPEDWQRLQKESKTAWTETNRFATEYRVRHKDNQYVYVLDQGIVVARDADGRPVRIVGSTTDITPRKQAEIALRESEARLRLALKATRTVYWERDLSNDQLLLSGNFTDPTAPQVMSYQAALPLVHPDDEAKVRQANELAIAQRGYFEVEHRLKEAADQDWRWVLARGTVLTDPTGNPTRLVGVSLDITGRKRAEAALRATEERLTFAQHAANAGVWDWDILTDKAVCSQEYYDLHGFEPEVPLTHGRWLGVILEEDRELINQQARRAIKHHTELNIEFRVRHPLRGVRWLNAIGQTFYNPDGLPVRVSGITLDITIRKLAEESLQINLERFDLIIEGSQVGLWYCDLPLNRLVWSDQCKAHFGLPSDAEVTIDTFYQQLHPEDRARLQQVIDHTINHRGQYDVEYRTVSLEGQVRWIRAVGRVFSDANGNPNRFDGITIDITASKQQAEEREQLLQREQAAREEAEAANRLKDEFLAVLSHELRTPLNPILGWAKLLQSRKFNQQTTAQALETIERNAKVQTQLIEDLLDISRILQGKLSLNMAPVSLVSTIEAAMETVNLAATAKSIQIQLLLDPDSGQVLGDSGRLQQVVWNLLSNAVKFTPQGGQVEVRLERVEQRGTEIWERGNTGVEEDLETPRHEDTSKASLSASPHHPFPTSISTPYAQITVSDTGKGIPSSFLPHVFDYFRQADSTTTRKFGGLGLGLAIVRQIVELHGGTVQAESPGEGQGATFKVRLPLSMAAPEPNCEDTLSHDRLNLNGLQVLLVDDDQDTGDFLAFLLEQEGATVTAVTSAAEALSILSQAKPNLLISDIGMPDMDGYVLMRQLRARPPEQGGQIPAIALTAYAGAVSQQQALAAGFQCHLAKPVEPDKLVKVMISLLKPV